VKENFYLFTWLYQNANLFVKVKVKAKCHKKIWPGTLGQPGFG
jgi:hypothetical protein